MSFDPCPAALTGSRVASWKFAGETGSWLDVTGTYSLTNNNTVRVEHQDDGRAYVGPAACTDYEAGESWSTTEDALIRDGNRDFTKVGIIQSTRADFDAQVGVCQFYHGISAGNSSILLWDMRTFTGSSYRWTTARNGTFGFIARTFNPIVPVLMAVKYDATADEIRFQAYKLSDSTQQFNQLYSSLTSITDINTDYYGRTAPADDNSDYYGSQTIIDGIQVFSSVLTDAEIQSICEHWRTQQIKVQEFLRGLSV